MIFLKKINAIAIDGPAGSGKSTVSRLVAGKLGFTYIDTGAMYRALTLKVMRQNIPFGDEEAIIKVSSSTEIKLIPTTDSRTTTRVLLDGEDVSELVRTMEVTKNVKYVAKIPGVRANLVKIQRKMAGELEGAVMEGRDIGTVVLPNARYKIYLDASFPERVERRMAELAAKGKPASQHEVEEDIKQRDHSDKTREVGPLRKADDAVLIDTTDLTIDQVVEKIVSLVRK